MAGRNETINGVNYYRVTAITFDGTAIVKRHPVADVYTNTLVIYGTDGNDTFINNTALSSHVNGYGGDDTIYGGSRGDRIYGGSGNDRLWGGDGNDILYGQWGRAFLNGGYDNDFLDSGYDGIPEYNYGGGADTFVQQFRHVNGSFVAEEFLEDFFPSSGDRVEGHFDYWPPS